MAAMGIYGIRNKRTGRTYVGASINIVKRWESHYKALCRPRYGSETNENLWHDWKSDGEDAFELVILEVVAERTMLKTREDHWIDHLGPSALYNAIPLSPARWKRFLPAELREEAT